MQSCALSETKPTLAASLKAPGTCGELIQGVIDDEDFLINCPIDRFSEARLYSAQSGGVLLHNGEQHRKIENALEIFSTHYRVDTPCTLVVDSDIPRGKGMASSTADITAALMTLSQFLKLSMSAHEFSHLVAQIEPSDGVHFDGVSQINHLSGKHFFSSQAPLGLRVLVVDCGGEIDTVQFDRQRARDYYRQKQEAIKIALQTMRRGLKLNNPFLVAIAATMSARLSQAILYKPQFDDLLRTVLEVGAIGVNCAHSGTVLGVLHLEQDRLRARLEARIKSEFGSSISIVGDHKIIGGGCYELTTRT